MKYWHIKRWLGFLSGILVRNPCPIHGRGTIWKIEDLESLYGLKSEYVVLRRHSRTGKRRTAPNRLNRLNRLICEELCFVGYSLLLHLRLQTYWYIRIRSTNLFILYIYIYILLLLFCYYYSVIILLFFLL